MQQSYCMQQRELHHDGMAQAQQTKMDRRILWINYGQNAVKRTMEDKSPSQDFVSNLSHVILQVMELYLELESKFIA
jgi:hypothetical protein